MVAPTQNVVKSAPVGGKDGCSTGSTLAADNCLVPAVDSTSPVVDGVFVGGVYPASPLVDGVCVAGVVGAVSLSLT